MGAEALAERIAEYELRADSIERTHRVWYHLAHARKEWAWGNWPVVERDLAVVEAEIAKLAERGDG